jgi:hypothetical protein
VVYDVDNTGHWRALPLQRDPASGTWSAGASFSGDQVQYFVEACDMAGNCGYSSNKGRYFDAQPLPAATGAVTLTPSRTPDAGSWYTGALAVSAASTSNAHVSVSVDGGPFAPANSAITVSGDGVHVVDARASDGSEATRVFMIDSRAPAITRTVTPAAPGGANGWYTTAPTVAFSCADDVSGVAAGSCTVDGSALPVAQITLGESAAAQTVAATAADNAGNVAHDAAAGLKVDLTDPAAPTFTGVEAKTYAIANIPAQAAIGCVSSDAGSGLLRCVVTGYSPLLGAHTLTALATDNAGRTSTSHLTYVVGFQSGNALPPLAAPGGDQTSPTAGDLQLFKIKSTVPVKFRMYRDAAKSILMTTPPAGSVARLTFGKNGSSTPLITASASSDNLFRWTGAPDYQYLYNLQTAGVGAGTYYVTLTLFASDGVTALAQSAKQYFLLRS